MSISTELISGLLGALIGGLFTLAGAHYEVKRQLEHQKTLDAENELQANIKALKSIRMEITHNVYQAEMFFKLLNEQNEKRIRFSDLNATSVFHLHKWRLHSDTLTMIEYPEVVDKIEKFYASIYMINATEAITIQATIALPKQGKEILKVIDEAIQTLKGNTDELKVP